MSKPTLVFDTEIYRDYFLVSFLNVETGNVRSLELYDGHPLDIPTLRAILSKYRLVSFNGINFDMVLLAVALRGGSCADLKVIANKIILSGAKYWQLGIDLPECDHIDLIEVAPGIASLKIYGGRLHRQRMQDLPIDPDACICDHTSVYYKGDVYDTPDLKRRLLRDYCNNSDLPTTLALFRKLGPQITLREQMSEQYGIDLRSKSDAQIAEAVIRHEVEKRMGRKLQKQDPFRLAGETFQYSPPSFVADMQMQGCEAASKALHAVRCATFTIGSNGVVLDPFKNLKVKIGNSTYQMGIGGLHSTEKSVAHFADDDHILVDRDVASYYPAIILNCGLKPAHMGEHFTNVYRGIVQRRLAAKRAGDKVTADALKITINGSFGKFGSPYSQLYSPTLLIQTTVTGQLSLLMLIEMLESEGISVVSANTDGIVIKCPRSRVALMNYVVWEWEHVTGFETEETHYQALYSRDVNNYLAVKLGGGYKAKGVFAPAGLQKNPTNEVCVDAVGALLMYGKDIEDTIHKCRDITKFVTIRTVKGGAMKGDQYLGKAVRWYYAQGETGTIQYKLNGYTVARSEGARPMMDLSDAFPNDLDHEWYIAEAYSILADIGAKVERTQPCLQD